MTDGIKTLRKNLQDQQERLLQQLADLEEVREDLDESEYEESKTGTLEQIVDITQSLCKLESGNLTLLDELGSQKLVSQDKTKFLWFMWLQSTQTAIRNAFHTPEVIRMFAKREPDQLRQRLTEKERDHKLGKLGLISFNQQKVVVSWLWLDLFVFFFRRSYCLRWGS